MRVKLTLGSVMKTDGGLDLSRTSRLLIFLMRLLMSGLYLRRIYIYTHTHIELSLFVRKYDFLRQNIDGCSSPTVL